MPVSLETMMADLDPERRQRIEERAAELIARFPARPPLELAGIAESDDRD